MVKKWVSFAVILLVLAAITVAGYRYFRHAQVHPNTDDAYVSGDVFSISSRIPGTLTTVEVTANQDVKRGQVIATLDPRDYDAQVEQASAALDEARTALATNRAQIEQAKAKADADASKLTLAHLNLDRFSELYKRNSAPKQRYDDAVTAEQVAAADAAASQKALAAVEANLAVAERRVKLQETRLANAELTRSYCTIVSPIDGVVSRKSAEVGQVVAPGQPLCAVVPLAGDHIWVEANFKETELRRIRPGLPATFHTDVDPAREYRGWVESLSAGTGAAFSLLPPENATGNWVKIVQRLPVRIAIDPASNADHSLRLGLSVSVEVDTLAQPRLPAETAKAAAAQ
ncbi:MAG TPA: HlyD family secretion protein [Thermoanaerobaculaceae bacterium]|nr:HlyD family secretion protein [Thermoanaerobaculaceae bacterium]